MEDTLPVMLVNARHARNIPGHKTDLLTELRGHRARSDG